MSDFLLELSKNPNVRKAVASLGLPLPMPQVLRRALLGLCAAGGIAGAALLERVED